MDVLYAVGEYALVLLLGIPYRRPQFMEEAHRMGKNSGFNNATTHLQWWKHEKFMPFSGIGAANVGRMTNMCVVNCVYSIF
jgi:hypothetical protein